MRPTSDHDDPTGMRAVLRSLPEPGPMPDDLVARIHSSLDEALASPSQPRFGRYAGHVAVAAALLVVGGVGLAALLSPSWLSGSDGEGSPQMSNAVGRPSTAQPSPSVAATAGELAPGSSQGSDAPGSSDEKPSATMQFVPGPVQISHTDRVLSTSTLARDLAQSPPNTPGTSAPVTTSSVGTLGTEAGARSCLTALQVPRETSATVELVSLDTKPSALIQVADSSGERTAYIVGRDCAQGNPELLHGPLRVA